MLDFNKVKSDADYKWPGIFSALGVSVGDGRHGPCPSCGGRDRFRFDNKDGKGSWICNQCNPHAGDGWDLIMKVLNIDFKTACEEVAKIVGTVESSPCQKEKAVSPDVLRRMFIDSEKVKKGDKVHQYLYYRGIRGVPPDTLRFLKKCWERETQKYHPAMLAVFFSADGEALTMHRTYLNEYGNKLGVKSPKKMMPAIKKMTGGSVRLYPWEEGPLGIAEGIETALAVHEHEDIPVWAALSANLMEGWIPPKSLKELRVYADADRNYTGQKAAYSLANRLSLIGINVLVIVPDKLGTDFLDQWMPAD